MLAKTSLQVVGLTMLVLFVGAADNDPHWVWGNIAGGARLSISFDKSAYKLGEPVNFHVMIQNVSRDRLNVGGVGEFPFKFEIYAPNGDWAPLTLWGRKMARPKAEVSSASVILHRGDSWSADFQTLNAAYDMTLPGRYSIVFVEPVISDSDPEATVSVMSNTVIVEVEGYGAK
jgi:hypothetical protein